MVWGWEEVAQGSTFWAEETACAKALRQGGECGWSVVSKGQGDTRRGRGVAMRLTVRGFTAYGKEFGFILSANEKLSQGFLQGSEMISFAFLNFF